MAIGRRVRVLHVIPSVSARRGGPSLAVDAFAQSLSKVGVDVHVATTDDDGPGHLSVPLGCPVEKDAATVWYFRRQSRFYTMSWPLTRWLAQHVRDYDVLHIHALFTYAALPASLFAIRDTVPYVVRPLGTLGRWGVTRRHPRLKRLSYRLIERRILARAARVHYTCEQEQREAAELGSTGCGVVIPLGLDVEQFDHLPPSGWIRRWAPQLAGRTIVLFLSRLDPKKGLDLLLPAFASLKQERSDVGLVIAGDGELEFVRRLRSECVRLRLEGDVYWAGPLTGESKLGALADADLFVLPSYSENFGLAVIEAMAAGKPIIISDGVGIHRDVAAAEAGIVVPCTQRGVADALRALSADA